MGDAEGKERGGSPATSKFVESILLQPATKPKLKANVLKIAHHGSETSSTADFINAVDPQIVVVSSAERTLENPISLGSYQIKRLCNVTVTTTQISVSIGQIKMMKHRAEARRMLPMAMMW